MKQFDECKTLNDMKDVLYMHAKRNGLHLGEIWVEDYWLCYIMWERVDTEKHRLKKLQYFQDKYGRKLEHTGTTMNASSKWKDHTGKINLCKCIDPRKRKTEEIKRRIHAETGERPNW